MKFKNVDGESKRGEFPSDPGTVRARDWSHDESRPGVALWNLQ